MSCAVNVLEYNIETSHSLTGLLDLANSYCEPILKRHCEQIIRHGISVSNVAMLYAAAIKYEAKVRLHFLLNP